MSHKEPDFCRYRDAAAWYLKTPKWVLANMVSGLLAAKYPDWLQQAEILSAEVAGHDETISQGSLRRFAKEKRDRPKLKIVRERSKP